MSILPVKREFLNTLREGVQWLARFRLGIPSWGIAVIGALLILLSLKMLTTEMGVSVDETDPVELFIALDCGPPEIAIEPVLDEGTLRVTVFAYRTRRVSGRDCHLAIIGARVPVRDLKWRKSLFPRKDEVVIPIDRDERGSSAAFAIPDDKGGVLEFVVGGGLTRIDRARFRLDVTMGHSPARELSSEVRRQFRSIAPNTLNIGVIAPSGYSRESGFPEPSGGQSRSKRRVYRFSLPYVFSVEEGREGDPRPYFDQSDLSMTFVSVSELERKNYLVIISSTLLGLGVALFVDALVVSRAPKPPQKNGDGA